MFDFVMYGLASIVISLGYWSTIGSSHRSKNTLYKCTEKECNRLYRRWQLKLTQNKENIVHCPHCRNAKERLHHTHYYDNKEANVS